MTPDFTSDCGTVQLYCADCLAVLPTLAAGSVDAVVTDPPYGIDYQSARRIDRATWKPKIANDERPFVWFLPAARTLTNDGGCLLCFCRWDVQECFRAAMGWAGWTCKAQIIWDRESHGMGDLNGCPAPQHDVIWFATVGNFRFHADRPKSVVRSLRLGGEELEHPNEKPQELMDQLCESYAPRSSTILDPFMGSGTTGVAAVRTGRRFIGIEICEKYYLIAKRRIQDELRKVKFLEPTPVETQREFLEAE